MGCRYILKYSVSYRRSFESLILIRLQIEAPIILQEINIIYIEKGTILYSFSLHTENVFHKSTAFILIGFLSVM